MTKYIPRTIDRSRGIQLSSESISRTVLVRPGVNISYMESNYHYGKRPRRVFVVVTVVGLLVLLYTTGQYHSLIRGIAHHYYKSRKPYNEEHGVNSTSVSIYIEDVDSLDDYFVNTYLGVHIGKYSSLVAEGHKRCRILNGTCFFERDNPKADVVFKFTRLYRPTYPTRYCERQILAVMNSEAEVSCSSLALAMLDSANIRMTHHLTSEVVFSEACFLPWKEDQYSTPDPSKKKGIALVMSNCKSEWRNKYIMELMKHIHIDSYGRCFHNVDVPPSFTYVSLVHKYRMVITFENTLQNDYISEKIVHSYEAGVIPVYWGPPEIYLWVPGNHTFIDPQRFKGPKELAEYLKRVDEDDDLFRFHTTNFDFEKTREMISKHCKHQYPFCRLCQVAQNIKLSRIKEGLDPPTC